MEKGREGGRKGGKEGEGKREGKREERRERVTPPALCLFLWIWFLELTFSWRDTRHTHKPANQWSPQRRVCHKANQRDWVKLVEGRAGRAHLKWRDQGPCRVMRGNSFLGDQREEHSGQREQQMQSP
jgi:hypothetical protein